MTRDEEWLLWEKWQGKKTEGFAADCARLAQGEPLAYIIGHIPFLDTTIFLDSRPLIPRPETEYWVLKTIEKMRDNLCHAPVHVLDLCSGSGCIGVSVLKAVPSTHVDFVEKYTRHHATIRKNVRENEIGDSRTHIYGGDLYEEVTGTYDYILANPPYIDKTLNRASTSVLRYEPHTALFAEQNGMEIIERIIAEAPHYLKEHGVLVVEHEPEHVRTITLLGETLGFTLKTQNDQYNIPRYTTFTRPVDESVSL